MVLVSSSSANFSRTWLDRTKVESIALFDNYSKYTDAACTDAKQYRARGSDYQKKFEDAAYVHMTRSKSASSPGDTYETFFESK